MKKNLLSTLKQEAANENTSQERLKELANENNTLAKIVAENAATPADILRQLSNSKSSAVRKAVTGNPNTPTDILFKLGEKFPEQFLANPIFDLLILEYPNLLNDLPRKTLKKILTVPEIPKYFLESVLKKSHLELIDIILDNPNTSRETLEQLLKHENPEIKQKAKLHINYMGEILENWQKIALEEIKNTDRALKNSQVIYPLIQIMPYAIEFISKSTKDYLVAFADFKIDRNLNYNPQDPLFLLEILANTQNEAIRISLAENSNTPVYLLEFLAKDPDIKVRENIAENSSTPVYLLENLAKAPERAVRSSVVINSNTPVYLLENLAKDRDYFIRASVARNKHTPITILEILAKDPEDWVRNNVAKNSNTPIKILEILAEDRDINVRKTVAKNSNTSIDILEILAEDLDKTVRENVAENNNTPVDILKILAEDLDKTVRENVAKNNNTPVDILKILAEDPEDWVRKNVAENRNTPDYVLAKLAKNADYRMSHILLKNPHTPISGLKILAESEDELIRRRVVNHINCSIELLEYLAKDYSQEVRASVAKNVNCPLYLLENLAKDKQRFVRGTVVNNPNCSIELLEYLAKDYSQEVRACVARNLNTPIACLEKLAEDTASIVRITTLKNHNCSPELIQNTINNLAKDILEKSEVNPRIAKIIYLVLINNPATPKNIVQSLIDRIGYYKDDYSFCRNLALNPNTPSEILRAIYNSMSDNRYALLDNPNITVDILEKLVDSKDSHLLVKILSHPKVTYQIKKAIFNRLIKLDRSRFTRLLVFFSSHADPALLSRYANSSYWFERYAIATNSNTPEKTLEKLTRDANAIVRAAAKANLTKNK